MNKSIQAQINLEYLRRLVKSKKYWELPTKEKEQILIRLSHLKRVINNE